MKAKRYQGVTLFACLRWLGNTTIVLSLSAFSVLALISTTPAQEGNLLWATQAGGTSRDDWVRNVTDSSGNSYLSDGFQDTAIFGPGEANQTILTGAVYSDLFVAKCISTGALIWARRGR